MVITDIQLSNSSGLDLVRHLRSEFGQDLPVIVVSGNTDSDLSEQVHAAGGTSFLAKPVGRKRLFLEINRLLGGATD